MDFVRVFYYLIVYWYLITFTIMRKSKIGICKTCKDSKKIHSKKMCQKCYVKDYRKTPSGMKTLKNYNDGKGKEAQKRWRLKHYVPREQKVLNKDKVCNCGSVVVAKDLCSYCYQRKRYDSIPRPEGYIKKKRGPVPSSEKIITEETFNKLIELVSIGVTVHDAIENVGCHRFYEFATDLQKIEIKLHKSTTGSRLLY